MSLGALNFKGNTAATFGNLFTNPSGDRQSALFSSSVNTESTVGDSMFGSSAICSDG